MAKDPNKKKADFSNAWAAFLEKEVSSDDSDYSQSAESYDSTVDAYYDNSAEYSEENADYNSYSDSYDGYSQTYDNTAFTDESYDNEAYDNNSYDNSTAYENTEYDNTAYDNTSYSQEYDKATYDNTTYDNSTYDEEYNNSYSEDSVDYGEAASYTHADNTYYSEDTAASDMNYSDNYSYNNTGGFSEMAADNKEKEVKQETADKKTDATDTAKQAETKTEEKQTAKEVKPVKPKKEKKEKRDKKDDTIKELQDKLVRTMAEFDNYRKRTEKEKSAMFEVGAKSIVEKVLPVIDNFERGLDAVSEDEKENAFVQGVDKIYKQFMTMLEEAGVKTIEAAGKEFNPEFHNAVMHVEDDSLGENIVAEEFQKGYTYRDSVVRHSMVKVAN